MRKIILFITCFLTYGFVLSQSFQFNRQIKGVELPTDNVSGVIQDDKGLMWFNTNDGVFYSDGIFTYTIPDEISSQLTNKVKLFKDEDGYVWVANQIKDAKAFYFKDGLWQEKVLPEALSEKEGLTYLEFAVTGKGKDKKVFLFFANEAYYSVGDSKSWIRIEHNFYSEGWLRSIYEKDGKTYLFFELATFFMDGVTVTEIEYKGLELPSKITHISYSEEHNKYYYLGKGFLASGVGFLEVDEIIHQGFINDIYSAVDYADLQISQGKIYYFFNSQLYKYSPALNQIQEISAADAIKSISIYSAFVDREGIIWIGTHRGLVNINSIRFLNFDSRILLDDEVTALIRLKENKYLIGYNNGLQLLDGSSLQTLLHDKVHASQPRNRITNFSRDKNGIIWFSSNLAGVGRYDEKTNSLGFEESPVGKFVTAVRAIGDSLIIVSRDKIYLSNINNKLSGHFSNDITNLILGSFNQDEVFLRKVGLLKDGRMIFMQGGNTFLQNVILETSQFINVIGFDYLELNDEIYLGTENGLKIYKDGEVKELELNGQKITRPVYALHVDKDQNIWAGTDQGVYLIGKSGIVKYDEKSGLVGSEINRGALIDGDNGEIFIGTQRGLSIYYPDEDDRKILQPITEILELNLLNKGIPFPSSNKIQFENNSIEVKYRAVSFLQNSNLTVRYKLEGYHDSWQEIVNPRSNVLVFNNLPPGDYVFKMEASLRGIYDGDIISSQPFTILKPIYLQTWFVIFILLLFFGIGFLLNAFMNQWRKQSILKQTIDEKTKQAVVSENQFKNVWNSSADGLMLSIEGGKILEVNPSFAKLVGFDIEDLSGSNIKDLYSDPNYYHDQKQKVISVLDSNLGEGATFEMEMPLKNGLRYIEMYITRLNTEFDEKPIMLSVFRDVTDKKDYEKGLESAKVKAEEANKLKSNILSNMSHEVRTPLNGILGSTENIIEQWGDDAELVSQLDIIYESGERLLSTINSILDMAKIEANKFEVVYQETNVNDFVGKVLLPLKTLAIKKGLLLSTKFETKPFIGIIDQRYFGIIINNLVGNAIKYTDEGLISIKVGKVNSSLVFEVSDNGIGMTEDFMKKLFRPFEQESEGYGRKYEGTGLGLTITKNLIDILNGEIKIESLKGNGTYVKVILPLGNI
ncbi:ATP-binding protein [Belliella sp. R4-6]|uniref:histidine kinase n=1 Tax=Belliella alkalica TaxID=1730871 RepID=A0ABS9VCM5_9BACT|nr:ATP-binding protein [Belliella alkalica]MCH7413680.1 ATP-binding protein [Belliella alkalica]